MRAADILRTLVKEIVPYAAARQLQIDVRGDLAGILAISFADKRSASLTGADTGTTTQKSRPKAADLRDLGSQFDMVAGAGFEPAAFRL